MGHHVLLLKMSIHSKLYYLYYLTCYLITTVCRIVNLFFGRVAILRTIHTLLVYVSLMQQRLMLISIVYSVIKDKYRKVRFKDLHISEFRPENRTGWYV